MKATVKMVLRQNLKALKLSTMFSCLEEHVRQASQAQQSYEEFLLGLIDIELQVRADNRLKRRLKEASQDIRELRSTENVYYDRRKLL